MSLPSSPAGRAVRADLKLQVFNSFAEAEEAERREQWAMSVRQRMQLVERLRQVAYGYTEEEGEDPAGTLQRLPRTLEVLPQAWR